ncbi:hypothetical protein [Ciceribacter selenitireducens]
MLHLYLDTALLAVPNYGFGSNPDDVQELIERVTHFSIVLAEGLPLRIVVADNVEAVLEIDYPTPNSIQDFLEAEGLDHVYATNDLFQQYLSLLDRAARPSDIGCFEVYNASAFASVPPLPPGLGPARLLSETERVCSAVAVHSGEPEMWLLGSSMNGTARTTFNIAATVDSASHDPSPRDGALAFSFNRPANLVENFSELADLAFAKELWRSAQSAEELHMAISLGGLALRRLKYPGANWDSLRAFSLGSEFAMSLRQHNCGGTQNFSNTTFDLCAQIIADIGLAKISPMGRPQQKLRASDNARAFRSHITTGNPALRLLLWETAAGLEFANVGPKKELYIETGRQSLTASVDLSALL